MWTLDTEPESSHQLTVSVLNYLTLSNPSLSFRYAKDETQDYVQPEKVL